MKLSQPNAKIIYLYSYGWHIVKYKRFQILEMKLISPDILFEICTYMYLEEYRAHARVCVEKVAIFMLLCL